MFIYKPLTALALVAALALSACNPSVPTPNPPPPSPPSPPAPPSPPGDITSPTIVSISPSNGAIGIEKDVKLLIVFSEPMSRATTEAAYESTDIPSVSFAWSDGDTKLEIDPTSDLEYTETGKVYSFKIKSTATDLAGNKLAETNSSFTTLRELTRTLEGFSALDGDVGSIGSVNKSSTEIRVGDQRLDGSVQFKGFLSFSLQSLADQGLTVPERITAATLKVHQNSTQGTPYSDLGLDGKHLLLAHVFYGTILKATDFNTPILHDLGELSNNATVEYKVRPVLEAVRDDWTKRVDRDFQSQYMLYFPKATDNDLQQDLARFAAGEDVTRPPELEVKFLVP